MPTKKRVLTFLVSAFVVVCAVATATPAFAGDKERVLYRFCSVESCADGEIPNGGLVVDTSGNLYGTTSLGGAECPDGGVVFELMPGANGQWTEKVLHSFPCQTQDGFGPLGNVIFDAAGNLYGTTGEGGNTGCGGLGCGIVFELSPGPNGQWTETVLHRFGGDDGATPQASLIFDTAGNLYGTTLNGGAFIPNCDRVGCGTVFQLTPDASGQWTEKVLHSFNNDGKDGCWPFASLIIDAAGNLYGTASCGGGGPNECDGYGCGIVFELSPGDNGQWTETVLHRFNGEDGANPGSNLIFDSAGNLYGTTVLGGNSGCGDRYHMGCGTVFELMRSANGEWRENVLRSFYKGRDPFGGVIFDAAGNLYGTTFLGGRYWDGDLECEESDCGGTAFKLSPGANGKWTQTRLHSFGASTGPRFDGSEPTGSLIFDAAGHLYGTTEFGGDYCIAGGVGCGTVFEIRP